MTKPVEPAKPTPLDHFTRSVLKRIASGTTSGRALRQLLIADGIKLGGPYFYFKMSELEKRKLVASYDVPAVVDGESLKLRHFRLTFEGTALHQELNPA